MCRLPVSEFETGQFRVPKCGDGPRMFFFRDTVATGTLQAIRTTDYITKKTDFHVILEHSVRPKSRSDRPSPLGVAGFEFGFECEEFGEG